ncbi:hypothetical protein MHU86_24084 [Fragilaria crotonensis]|nr:hypothetical protein MHU86_24084 [Fragilaria crotonensis]
MVKLRPPSFVKSVTIPVFGMDWFGAMPSTSTTTNTKSMVAYCGGGGSAKTGVNNKIMIVLDDDEITISTGDEVCVAVKMFVHHTHPTDPHKVWLLAAIRNDVVRYGLPDCAEDGRIEVGGGCNALAVHALGEVFAVGCEDGLIHVYRMANAAPTNTTAEGNNHDSPWQKLFQCSGHEKTVCSLQFANRSSLLVSSAKDGTCRVWKQGGECVAVLTCDITDPKAPPPKIKSKRPVQVLVRGCAFGDLEGKVIYTVASGKKGTAFLTRWLATPDGNYKVDVRTAIHPFPISAMSLSTDAALLALGGVDGTILLFDVGSWSVLRQFKELHHLPVTSIAARPYATPLQGDGPVPMHAISASADSQMGMLTLITKVPRSTTAPSSRGEKNASHSSVFPSTFMSMIWLLLIYIFYTIGTETILLCSDELSLECVLHTVLIAPPTRPGILVPPH